jgi:hypothetical protein
MSPSTKRFIRHYVEMVAVMFLGMGVLALPTGWALRAAGSSWSELHTDAPALMLLGMAVTMTAPMVAWMAYRGHERRANAEMSAAMLVPTVGVIGLLWLELVTDLGVLLVIEHVAMFLSMLAAMLQRVAEYSGRHHGHSAVSA